MKVFFLFLIASLATCTLYGQHCPFDNTGIIVVKVVDAKTKETIHNITPYLTISKEDKKQNHLVLYPFSKNDSVFIKNPAATNLKWVEEYAFKEIRYGFADDNFICPVNLNLVHFKNLEIRLFNKKGIDVGVSYKVSSKDFYDLHENFGHNWFQFTEENIAPKPKYPFDKLIIIELRKMKK